MRCWLWLTLSVGIAVCAVGATDEEIARAVRQLGAADFKTREAASQLLWSAGKSAVPALEQASRSADPEVALRARQLLENIRLGILPDTPPEIRATLEQYRAGDLAQRRAIVEALVAKGEAGWNVLPLLAADVPALENRAVIFQAPLEQLAERIVAFVGAPEPAADTVAPAIRAAELWIGIVPEDISVPLRMISKLDAIGKRADADRLFRREFDFLQKTVAASPKDAEAHNNLAWLCAVARRRLDPALAAAQTAVQLAPQTPAYLDTLAEVQFQRGDGARAGELIRQAIELNPDQPYFQQQQERFQKGDRTVPPPEPLE